MEIHPNIEKTSINIVKEVSNRLYSINQTELDKSLYDDEIKAGMIVFAQYLNENKISKSTMSKGDVSITATNA